MSPSMLMYSLIQRSHNTCTVIRLKCAVYAQMVNVSAELASDGIVCQILHWLLSVRLCMEERFSIFWVFSICYPQQLKNMCVHCTFVKKYVFGQAEVHRARHCTPFSWENDQMLRWTVVWRSGALMQHTVKCWVCITWKYCCVNTDVYYINQLFFCHNV